MTLLARHLAQPQRPQAIREQNAAQAASGAPIRKKADEMGTV